MQDICDAIDLFIAGDNNIEEKGVIPTETFEKPANLEILAKFLTPEEFQIIYYRMIKNFAINHDKGNICLLALMWEMSEYCQEKMKLPSDETIKEVYGMHQYFLNNFAETLDDDYLYEIGRNVYTSLLRKTNWHYQKD